VGCFGASRPLVGWRVVAGGLFVGVACLLLFFGLVLVGLRWDASAPREISTPKVN
jgi:hypothetical protein